MTTKTKARKYRIKSPSAPKTAARPTASAASAANVVSPETDSKAKISPDQKIEKHQEPTMAQEIDAIRREGLTGRQLRMARRVAQKNGLAPTSDYDAVRLLRAKGIDPFQRSNVMDLIVSDPKGDEKTDRVQLPQTVQEKSTELAEPNPAIVRTREISEIQHDIARRRRKRLLLLATRLCFFVALPAFLAGFYYYTIATPMYSTKTEILILQADGGTKPGGLGGLLPTQFATQQDALAVQSYLQSRDAMIQLNDKEGYKSLFSSDWIDPLQRLSASASSEDEYKLYKKKVKISYDPTEGVVKMEVIAPDPQKSTDFSNALIKLAEGMVDDLSARKRQDGLAQAEASLQDARSDRRAAQIRLVDLQEQFGVDPEGVVASLRSQITNFETQLLEKEIELQALLDNNRPNRAKVAGVRGDIDRIQGQLDRLNVRMRDATEGQQSLARIQAEIEMAKADLVSADMILQAEMQSKKAAEQEAIRQVRYLTVPVKPVTPDAAVYPRAFENTLVSFLIFAGIYLLVSLTASILREQVSS